MKDEEARKMLAMMLGDDSILIVKEKKKKESHKQSTCRICEEEFTYEVKKGKPPRLCQESECRKTHRRNIRKPKPKVIRKNVCIIQHCANVIVQTGKGRTITHCDECKSILRSEQNAEYRSRTFVPLQRVGLCIDCDCQLETMTGRGKMKQRCTECQKKNHAKIARESAKLHYIPVIRIFTCRVCKKEHEQEGRGKLRVQCTDCVSRPAPKPKTKSAAQELLETLSQEQKEAIALWKGMSKDRDEW
tara:strand:+ start:1625 stop:2362 length:738 start_codon:yes stop_codon:yes gene_type:complete